MREYRQNCGTDFKFKKERKLYELLFSWDIFREVGTLFGPLSRASSYLTSLCKWKTDKPFALSFRLVQSFSLTGTAHEESALDFRPHLLLKPGSLVQWTICITVQWTPFFFFWNIVQISPGKGKWEDVREQHE